MKVLLANKTIEIVIKDSKCILYFEPFCCCPSFDPFHDLVRPAPIVIRLGSCFFSRIKIVIHDIEQRLVINHPDPLLIHVGKKTIKRFFIQSD